MPDVACGAVLELSLQRLHAARDVVKLADALVTVDRISENREERRGSRAPLLVVECLHRSGVRVVAEALEVGSIDIFDGRVRFLRERGGGKRKRSPIFAPGLNR